jgi:hypothetical protein
MRRLQVSSGFQAERNRLLRLATVFCLLALCPWLSSAIGLPQVDSP